MSRKIQVSYSLLSVRFIVCTFLPCPSQSLTAYTQAQFVTGQLFHYVWQILSTQDRYWKFTRQLRFRTHKTEMGLCFGELAFSFLTRKHRSSRRWWFSTGGDASTANAYYWKHARTWFSLKQKEVSPCISMLFQEKAKLTTISLVNRWRVIYMQTLKYSKIHKEQQSTAEVHKN